MAIGLNHISMRRWVKTLQVEGSTDVLIMQKQLPEWGKAKRSWSQYSTGNLKKQTQIAKSSMESKNY